MPVHKKLNRLVLLIQIPPMLLIGIQINYPQIRVLINIIIPLFMGSLFVFRLATSCVFELIAPACLIFYGLSLVNASKYTLDEIRYLGFTQLFIGIINLWILGYGLIFWGIGFGLVHIIFGIIIWWKYEKNGTNE